MRELRGNVDTRLRKLAEGGYDAIVLARAGLARLGRADEGAPLDAELLSRRPARAAWRSRRAPATSAVARRRAARSPTTLRSPA